MKRYILILVSAIALTACKRVEPVYTPSPVSTTPDSLTILKDEVSVNVTYIAGGLNGRMGDEVIVMKRVDADNLKLSKGDLYITNGMTLRSFVVKFEIQ